jgi:hypothetical protein
VALPAFLQRVLDWVHAGYPQGVPQKDYYPLLAFLTTRLTADQVTEVVASLQVSNGSEGQPSAEEVRSAITAVTSSPPSAFDIERVEQHLREAGWEL